MSFYGVDSVLGTTKGKQDLVLARRCRPLRDRGENKQLTCGAQCDAGEKHGGLGRETDSR